MIVHVKGGPYDGRTLRSTSEDGAERKSAHDFIAYQKGIGTDVHITFDDDSRLSQNQFHIYELVAHESHDDGPSELTFEYRGIVDWRT